VPRLLDERASADLFFADLTGQTFRRRPPRRSGQAEAFAEDAPARSTVMNPGFDKWTVMVGSVPSKRDPPLWAGAIRQKSVTSEYTGWERRSESVTLDKKKAGAIFDLLVVAYVNGQLKGTDGRLYVMDATVTASAPRDISTARPRVGTIDIEVGYDGSGGTRRITKASWDSTRQCARLVLPVRVSYSKKDLPPDFFEIVWFGNGDKPELPSTLSP
jgi:hypothetical protein